MDSVTDHETSTVPEKNRNLTGGSRKGVPNKTTSSAKDAIAKAAEKLGGANRLVEWAQEHPTNERIFWGTIYPKLLPLQVTGEGGGPVRIVASQHDETL